MSAPYYAGIIFRCMVTKYFPMLRFTQIYLQLTQPIHLLDDILSTLFALFFFNLNEVFTVPPVAKVRLQL